MSPRTMRYLLTALAVLALAAILVGWRARRDRADAESRVRRHEERHGAMCERIRRDLEWASLVARERLPPSEEDRRRLEVDFTTVLLHADGACLTAPPLVKETLEALYGHAPRAGADVPAAVRELDQAMAVAARRGWPLP